MIVGVGPGEGLDAGAGRAAVSDAGGVVARPGLFDRLGGPARVAVVSAPPGSGKTVLDRQLVPQHQDLYLLLAIAHRQQPHEGERVRHGEIGQV